MSGNRYLLDTNAIIALLDGNDNLLAMLQDASWIGISIISVLEFFAFPNLTEKDRRSFSTFQKRVNTIDLNSDQTELITRIVQMRLEYKLKLPDAIILASATNVRAALVTTDQQLLRISSLEIQTWSA